MSFRTLSGFKMCINTGREWHVGGWSPGFSVYTWTVNDGRFSSSSLSASLPLLHVLPRSSLLLTLGGLG